VIYFTYCAYVVIYKWCMVSVVVYTVHSVIYVIEYSIYVRYTVVYTAHPVIYVICYRV